MYKLLSISMLTEFNRLKDIFYLRLSIFQQWPERYNKNNENIINTDLNTRCFFLINSGRHNYKTIKCKKSI